MSEAEKPVESPAAEGPDSADRSSEVLGNLPRRRPGRRSPERDRAAAARERAAARAASGPASRPAGSPRLESEPRPAGGIEGLARTGVALASDTITLGARLAGRALGAVRDLSGR